MFESALKLETTLLKQIINFSDKRTGGTPLIVAVVNGYTEIVRILVQAGADVNVEDRYVCIYCMYIMNINTKNDNISMYNTILTII